MEIVFHLLLCWYDMIMFKVVIGDENEDHAMIAEENVMPLTQMRIDSNLRVFEKVETPWEKTELQQFRESLGLQQIRNQVTSKYQCNR